MTASERIREARAKAVQKVIGRCPGCGMYVLETSSKLPCAFCGKVI